MLRSINALHGYTVLATDGDIGKVDDFYFNDDTWVIRYLIVDTGHWLPGRKVLVAPKVLGKPNWTGLNFPVSLTRKQVEKSPDINTAKPVSRQQELDLHNYYGWPLYWNEPGLGALPPFATLPPNLEKKHPSRKKQDRHLRSTQEVTGYRLHATDGELGHVKDLIVDDDLWIVRYLVVHTGRWLAGKKVLVAPAWITDVRYLDQEVAVELTKNQVTHCPEFDPDALVNREYEERMYDYYGRPRYWNEEVPAEK